MKRLVPQFLVFRSLFRLFFFLQFSVFMCLYYGHCVASNLQTLAVVNFLHAQAKLAMYETKRSPEYKVTGPFLTLFFNFKAIILSLITLDLSYYSLCSQLYYYDKLSCVHDALCKVLTIATKSICYG